MATTPVVLSWSGGKDSALCLRALRQDPKFHEFHVVALLTTVAAEFDRVSHHGVRRELLERQADALGLPLHQLQLPANCTNADYEAGMQQALLSYREQQIYHIAFGDLFLEDLRNYRLAMLGSLQMHGVFPLWQQNTGTLMQTFIAAGFKARLCCVSADRLSSDFAGRELDAALLRDLPASVDPCGERGEYHSFVYDGPMFTQPVPIRLGETLYRDGRYFTDLL